MFSVQLRQSVRKFCAEQLAPYADEIDKKNEFPQMRVSQLSSISINVVFCMFLDHTFFPIEVLHYLEALNVCVAGLHLLHVKCDVSVGCVR